MSTKKVPLQLYKNTQAAVEDIYRYDRLERYILIQVLTAAEQGQAIDEVFIKCARKVLQRPPLDKSTKAA